MKYWAAGIVAGLVIGVGVCQGADLSFDTVTPTNKGKIMKVTGVERKALKKALALHNLMFEIRNLDQIRNQLLTTVHMRQVEEDRLAALEKCSIQKLEESFEKPEEVWNKMKEAYADREKGLSIYINSTEATDADREAFKRYMENGEMTPEMAAELFAPWRVGRDILVDVYQNQDQWGERPKTKENTTFPLWADQKYTFDKEWDSFYTKLNTYFGVPPQMRPRIGDEKYDYAKAEDVEKAHREYVALLAAKNPAKTAALPSSFRKPPIAPRPLPPKNEMMIYVESEVPEKQIYPVMPEPWKKYAEGRFADVNPTGEMAQDFSQGLTMKESAKRQKQTNRLVAYDTMSQTVDTTRRLESLVLEQADSRLSSLKEQLEQFLPGSKDTVDLLDLDQQAAVLQQLQQMYLPLLNEAELEMNRRDTADDDVHESRLKLEDIADIAELKKMNPEAFEELQTQMPASMHEQDQNLLAALKKDKEGRVFLNGANAGEVDKMMKETQAAAVMMQGRDELEKMLAASAAQPIDETCLNGGV
ncbi:MAG: hypothetical protein IJV07_05105 [Alphaproteobacteria bacterium]|nr:hypothetical protein [Alphaproteobacteria bacterium]